MILPQITPARAAVSSASTAAPPTGVTLYRVRNGSGTVGGAQPTLSISNVEQYAKGVLMSASNATTQFQRAFMDAEGPNAKKAAEDIKKQFDLMPTTSVQLDGHAFPNARVELRYMAADQYSTYPGCIIAVKTNSDFKATVKKIEDDKLNVEFEQNMTGFDDARTQNQYVGKAFVYDDTSSDPQEGDILLSKAREYWVIQDTEMHKFVSFGNDTEMNHAALFFHLTPYDYLKSTRTPSDLQTDIRNGGITRLVIQRTMAAERFLTQHTDSIPITREIQDKVHEDYESDDDVGRIAAVVTRHSKEALKQVRGDYGLDKDVKVTSDRVYDPREYMVISAAIRTLGDDYWVKCVEGGAGSRTVVTHLEKAKLFCKRLGDAVQLQKKMIDSKWAAKDRDTATKMKHVCEAIAMSKWLQVYGAHILNVDLFSMYMGFEAIAPLFKDEKEATVDPEGATPREIGVVQARYNKYLNSKFSEEMRYNSSQALDILGYDADELSHVYNRNKNLDKNFGFIVTRRDRTPIDWSDLINRNRATGAGAVDTRLPRKDTENFTKLTEIAKWDEDFKNTLTYLEQNQSYVDTTKGFLDYYDADLLLGAPCPVATIDTLANAMEDLGNPAENEWKKKREDLDKIGTLLVELPLKLKEDHTEAKPALPGVYKRIGVKAGDKLLLEFDLVESSFQFNEENAWAIHGNMRKFVSTSREFESSMVFYDQHEKTEPIKYCLAAAIDQSADKANIASVEHVRNLYKSSLVLDDTKLSIAGNLTQDLYNKIQEELPEFNPNDWTPPAGPARDWYESIIQEAREDKSAPLQEQIRNYWDILNARLPRIGWAVAEYTSRQLAATLASAPFSDFDPANLTFILSDDHGTFPAPLPGLFHQLLKLASNRHKFTGNSGVPAELDSWAKKILDEIEDITKAMGISSEEVKDNYWWKYIFDGGVPSADLYELAGYVVNTKVMHVNIDKEKDIEATGYKIHLYKFEYGSQKEMYPATALQHCKIVHYGKLYSFPVLDEQYLDYYGRRSSEKTDYELIKVGNDPVEVHVPLIWVGPFLKTPGDTLNLTKDPETGLLQFKDKPDLIAMHTWDQSPNTGDFVESAELMSALKTEESKNGSISTDDLKEGSSIKQKTAKFKALQDARDKAERELKATGGNPTFRHPLLEQYTFVISELTTAEVLTVVFVFLFNLPDLSVTAQAVLGVLIALVAVYTLYMAYYCVAWPFKARKRAPSVLQTLGAYRVDFNNLIFWLCFWLPLIFVWGNYPTGSKGVVPDYFTSYYVRPTYPSDCTLTDLKNCAAYTSDSACSANGCKAILKTENEPFLCYDEKPHTNPKANEWFVCSDLLSGRTAIKSPGEKCARDSRCGAFISSTSGGSGTLFGSCWKYHGDLGTATNGIAGINGREIEYPKGSGNTLYTFKYLDSNQFTVTYNCGNIFRHRTQTVNPYPPGGRSVPGFVIIFGVAILLSKFSVKRKFLPALATLVSLSLAVLSVQLSWSAVQQAQFICITISAGAMYFNAERLDSFQRKTENTETQRAYNLNMSQLNASTEGWWNGWFIWAVTLVVISILAVSFGEYKTAEVFGYFIVYAVFVVLFWGWSVYDAKRADDYMKQLRKFIFFGDVGALSQAAMTIEQKTALPPAALYDLQVDSVFDSKAFNTVHNTIVTSKAAYKKLAIRKFAQGLQPVLIAVAIVNLVLNQEFDLSTDDYDWVFIGIAIAFAVVYTYVIYDATKYETSCTVRRLLGAKWKVVNSSISGSAIVAVACIFLPVNYDDSSWNNIAWMVLPLWLLMFTQTEGYEKWWERRLMFFGQTSGAQLFDQVRGKVAPWQNVFYMVKNSEKVINDSYRFKNLLSLKDASYREFDFDTAEARADFSKVIRYNNSRTGRYGLPVLWFVAGMFLLIAAFTHTDYKSKDDNILRWDVRNAILCGSRVFAALSILIAVRMTINFHDNTRVPYPTNTAQCKEAIVRVRESLYVRCAVSWFYTTDWYTLVATRVEGHVKKEGYDFGDPMFWTLVGVGVYYSIVVSKSWFNPGKLTNMHVWHFFWSNTAVLISALVKFRGTIAHVSFCIALTLKFVLGLFMWSYLANKKSICLQAATMWDRDFSALRYMVKWWKFKPRFPRVYKIGPFTLTQPYREIVSFGSVARGLKRSAMIKDGVYVTESISATEAGFT